MNIRGIIVLIKSPLLPVDFLTGLGSHLDHFS